MLRRNRNVPYLEPQTQNAIPPFTGVLCSITNNVIITDKNQIHALRSYGHYGEFQLSRVKKRNFNIYRRPWAYIPSNFEYKVERLVLDPVEAFYLVYKLKILYVFDRRNHYLNEKKLWGVFIRDIKFILIYAAYEYYSDLKVCVKPTRNFGGHLALYTQPPDLAHSSYIIFIELTGNLAYSFPNLFCKTNYRMMGAVQAARKKAVLLFYDWPDEFKFGEGLAQLKRYEFLIKPNPSFSRPLH